MGIAQVVKAVIFIYQATQQNAALQEPVAAAVGSLRCQANELLQVVGVFKLDGHKQLGQRRPNHHGLSISSEPLVYSGVSKSVLIGGAERRLQHAFVRKLELTQITRSTPAGLDDESETILLFTNALSWKSSRDSKEPTHRTLALGECANAVT